MIWVGKKKSFTPLSLSGLVGWWDSKDNSTLTLVGSDVSHWVSKASGTLTPTQGSASQRPSILDVSGRQMISFDGVDEYLSLADAGATALKFGAGDFSWYVVYRTDDANRGVLLHKGSFAPQGYFMRINNADTNNGDFVTAIRDAASDLAQVAADDINYNDNTTRLIAMVKDGNNLRQYQNGAEVSESPADASAVGSLDDTNAFFMGTFGAGAQWYNGELGDVLAFNRALAAGERANLTAFLKTRWGIA